MRPLGPLARYIRMAEMRRLVLVPIPVVWDQKINISYRPSPVTSDDRRVVSAELRWLDNSLVPVTLQKQYWMVMD